MALNEDTIVKALLRDRATLFAYIWSIVRDAHVAEDVFQEVSLLALHKRGELREAEALPTWLRRSARNLSLKALRRLGRAPALLDEKLLDLLEGQWERQEATPAAETLEALKHCLAELSPYARQVITLRYAQGLSGEGVAAKLGRKAEAIYKVLTRAHGALAECVRRRTGRGEAPHV